MRMKHDVMLFVGTGCPDGEVTDFFYLAVPLFSSQLFVRGVDLTLLKGPRALLTC
jgi:hypothetical protein